MRVADEPQCVEIPTRPAREPITTLRCALRWRDGVDVRHRRPTLPRNPVLERRWPERGADPGVRTRPRGCAAADCKQREKAVERHRLDLARGESPGIQACATEHTTRMAHVNSTPPRNVRGMGKAREVEGTGTCTCVYATALYRIV